MVAERRDLMVETYSSYCGTGAAAMVCVCTGSACGAACGGADLAQAVSPSTATERQGAIQTGSLLKIKSSNAKNTADVFGFLYLQFDRHLLVPLLRFGTETFIQIVTLGCDCRR